MNTLNTNANANNRSLNNNGSSFNFVPAVSDSAPPRRDRDFGLGYGTSSGYAAQRGYIADNGPRLFRLA